MHATTQTTTTTKGQRPRELTKNARLRRLTNKVAPLWKVAIHTQSDTMGMGRGTRIRPPLQLVPSRSALLRPSQSDGPLHPPEHVPEVDARHGKPRVAELDSHPLQPGCAVEFLRVLLRGRPAHVELVAFGQRLISGIGEISRRTKWRAMRVSVVGDAKFEQCRGEQCQMQNDPEPRNLIPFVCLQVTDLSGCLALRVRPTLRRWKLVG